MNGLTPYPITPIGNFIGLVLALLPLISQIRKLSIGVWGYSIWVAVYNFTMFVDTIIWHDNFNAVAKIWCDVVTKLRFGSSIGTRASMFAICLHMYKITRIRAISEASKSQRRKTLYFELFLVIGIPVLMMALYIIVQPTRFDILEELGCTSSVYSYIGYIIQYGPWGLACLGGAVFAPLTLHTFLRHRREMNEFNSSGRNAAHHKYYRLMVIACLDTLSNTPVLIVVLVVNIVQGNRTPLSDPYISWKSVHYRLSSITQVPATDWSLDKWIVFMVKWNEWAYVFYAVLFFGVFGTTPEMRQYYATAFWFVPKKCGFKKKHSLPAEKSTSHIAFHRNTVEQARKTIRACARRRGSLSFLEAISSIVTSMRTVTGGAGQESIELDESRDLEIGVGTSCAQAAAKSASVAE